MRVSDEDNPVHAAQDQLAAGIVKDLAGDGVEVNAGLEAAYGPEIQGKKIEEKGSVGLCRERDHFALLLVRGFLVDDLQIRGLAAESGAIVRDFAIDLAGCEIDKAQDSPHTADIGARLRSQRKPRARWPLAVR